MLETLSNVKEFTDRLGRTHWIGHSHSLGTAPVELLAFFYRQMSELLSAGHGSSWIGHGNKCRAIYTHSSDGVTGVLVYDILTDQKRAWINFVSVDGGHRRLGLFSAMFAELEQACRQMGVMEISSFVHVDNHAKIASSSKHGMAPRFYRMSKILTK